MVHGLGKVDDFTFSSNHQLAMNEDPDALEQLPQWHSAVVDGPPRTSYFVFLQRQEPVRRVSVSAGVCRVVMLFFFLVAFVLDCFFGGGEFRGFG